LLYPHLQIEKLQALLADQEVVRYNFAGFDPLLLPLDPTIKIKAIIPEQATLFKVSINHQFKKISFVI
jgi:hypothetical protein